MKVCYIDESGAEGQSRCVVMVGVLVDTLKLNRTRVEFADIFAEARKALGGPISELKGSKILYGRDRWKAMKPDDRKLFIRRLCRWASERDAHLILTGIDFEKYKAEAKPDPSAGVLDPWLACALHIALQVQRKNQPILKNKGHSFLFFDEKNEEMSNLIFDPPAWTDDYYGKKKKQERLDQIIDPACSVKSHHAGLVQVADLYGFIYRRYQELHGYQDAEVFAGETALIDEYVGLLAPRLTSRSLRWPAHLRCACSRWYNAIAPAALLALPKLPEVPPPGGGTMPASTTLKEPPAE